MIAIFRKLARLTDALAFANVGNLGEFKRQLERAEGFPGTADRLRAGGEAAAESHRCIERLDPQFAGWMAKWDAMAVAAVGRVEALEVENAHLRRRLGCVMRDHDDLIAALARQDRVSGLG